MINLCVSPAYLYVITGDLCATDITMSDEDRKALMMMVKDGALTTEQAMGMVSFYLVEKGTSYLSYSVNYSFLIPFLEHKIEKK